MRAGGLKAAPAPGRSMKRGSACPASPASATEAPAAPATGADGHPAASKAAAAPTLDRDLDDGRVAPWDRSAPSSLPARLRAAATAALVRMPECVPYALMAALLLALLAVCLVPMVQIAAFDHSYADDWHYGVDAHLALEAGGGLPAALAAAVQEARDTFFSWQGTYSAILLMALQPGVFSEALYGLGAVAIIAVLAASTFYACGVAVREVLGADRPTWVAASCLVLLLQTQLIPSPVEGFYWYNSAIYYTFYHALTLVMLGMAARIARGCTRRGELTRAGMLLRAVLLCALALFVAGGNFVTGVVACLLMAGAVVATACLGRPRRALALAPALLALLAGFALSMAAPGNAERQATQYPDDALGVLPTLLRSGCAAVEYAVLWTGGLLILALAVALPFMVRAARRSPRAFARPWAPALLAFALFAASFTPTFYSMGNAGPGRVQNIRYDLFVLLVFVCAQWFVGWCVRRLERSGALEVLPAEDPWWDEDAWRAGLDGAEAAGEAACAVDAADDGVPLPSAAPAADLADEAGAACEVRERAAAPVPAASPRAAAYLGACAIVLALVTVAFAVDARHASDLTALSAAASLSDGAAAEYDRQVTDRLAYLAAARDRGETEVEVPYYSARPRVLYMGEIRDNMGNYINYRLAQWFGLDSVVGYSSPMQ